MDGGWDRLKQDETRISVHQYIYIYTHTHLRLHMISLWRIVRGTHQVSSSSTDRMSLLRFVWTCSKKVHADWLASKATVGPLVTACMKAAVFESV